MKNSHDIDLITKFSSQQPQQTAQQHPHNHFTPIRGFEEHNSLQQQKMIDPLMLSNDLSSIDEENDTNSLAEDDQERNALLEQLSSSNSFLLSTSATGGESGDDDDSEIKNYTKNDDLSERPYLLQGVSSPIWGTTHRQATIGPNTARTTEELIGDLSTDWQLLSSKTNNSQHYLPQQQHQVIATTTNGQTMMNLLNDNVLIQNNNNNSNTNIIYNGQNNNNNNNNSNDSNNINHVNSRSSSSMNSISTNINRMNINTGTTSTPNVQQPQQPIQYPTTNKNNTFQQQQPYFNQPQQQQQQQFNQSTSIASSSSSSQSSSSSSSPSMVSSLFITPSQVHQLNNNHYSSSGGGGGGGAASNVLSNDMLVGNSSMMSMLSNNNSNTTITTPVNDEMCTCPLRSLLNCPWYGNKLSLTVHLEQSCFPRFLRENITAAENGLPQQPQHILFKVRDNIVAGMNQYFSRETILRNCAKQLQVPEVVCAEVWKWMRSSNESFFHAYDMITLVVGQIEIFNELAQEMQANQDTRYHFNDPNVGLLLSQQQQTQSQVQQQQFLLHNESPMVGHQTTDSSNGATLSLDLSNQLLRQNYSQALTQTAGSQLPNSNASQQWSLLSQFQQMQQQTTLENNNNGRSSSAALNSPMTALSSRNQQVWIPQATSSMATNPMMNSGIAMGGASAVGTTTPSNTSPVMVNQFVSGGAMANSRMRKDVTKSKALKFHNYKQPTATTPGGGSSRRRSESSTPISFVNYSVANPRNNNSQ